ncbi:MAG: MoxR family ATPase [Clostridia bacterium]|nr:MoxR family ATPase [Clostridia bacterium]
METNNHEVEYSAKKVLAMVRRAVVGKDPVLVWVLAAILARGHILVEDVPGVGKTTMAVAFAKTLSLQWNRIQFTPEVLPSDVTGYSVLNPTDGTMTFRPGAVLCNLLLADELNRATSRTQSALLEAMEEGQVTVDGQTHPIPKPFVVIATQNPTGAAGTQMLPDSQMDRFAIRLRIGYPSAKDEARMVLDRQSGNPVQTLQPVLSREELTHLQELTAQTYLSETVVDYIVALTRATRTHSDVLQGASPRATLAVADMARAMARLKGRDFVTPEDVQDVFSITLAHRLLLTTQAEAAGVTTTVVLQNILQQTAAPGLGR